MHARGFAISRTDATISFGVVLWMSNMAIVFIIFEDLMLLMLVINIGTFGKYIAVSTYAGASAAATVYRISSLAFK